MINSHGLRLHSQRPYHGALLIRSRISMSAPPEHAIIVARSPMLLLKTALIIGNLFLVVFWASVGCFLMTWNDSLAYLVAFMGCSAGMIVGRVLPPKEKEKIQFPLYSKFVSWFISGYMLGKPDRIFKLIVEETRGLLIMNDALTRRFFAGFVCFLLVLSARFVWKRYYRLVASEPTSDKSFIRA